MSKSDLDSEVRRGIQQHEAGELTAAAAIYRKVLVQQPSHAQALHALGLARQQEGELGGAFTLVQRSVAALPDCADFRSNLAAILTQLGRYNDAINELQCVSRLRPATRNDYYNQSASLLQLDRNDEAIAALKETLTIDPNFPPAYNCLGLIRSKAGKEEEAVNCYVRALRGDPFLLAALNNLGCVRQEQGLIAEAIDCYTRALQKNPHERLIHSNLICCLQYRRGDEIRLENEIRAWVNRFGPPLARHRATHRPSLVESRRLKIGLVSGDFRLHSVAFFLAPFLEHFDRSEFEVTCYSTNTRIDRITLRFQSQATFWRNIAELSDDQVVAQIQEDEIDVLLDLSGYTGGGRLQIFSRRPAPLQLSYLGFPGPTGLPAIDFRVTDRHADPPHLIRTFSPDPVERLPQQAWCYDPLHELDLPAPQPPSINQGLVTFGCFNNQAKIGPDLLLVWAQILQRVPNSKLELKNKGLVSADVANYLRGTFDRLGLDPARLELRAPSPDLTSHMASYDRIDIALDTFPYNGTTTTCEALWMGVPVVTLAGDYHRARVGCSLLTAVGLGSLVAHRLEDYVSIAVKLAGETDLLANWRRCLRTRMKDSPLMDGKTHTRHFESLLRNSWSKLQKGAGA